LRKPETEFESADSYFVQQVNQNDAETVGHNEPDTQEDGEILQILFPILSFEVFLGHDNSPKNEIF
jgi:hypothetical protein